MRCDGCLWLVSGPGAVEQMSISCMSRCTRVRWTSTRSSNPDKCDTGPVGSIALGRTSHQLCGDPPTSYPLSAISRAALTGALAPGYRALAGPERAALGSQAKPRDTRSLTSQLTSRALALRAAAT